MIGSEAWKNPPKFPAHGGQIRSNTKNITVPPKTWPSAYDLYHGAPNITTTQHIIFVPRNTQHLYHAALNVCTTDLQKRVLGIAVATIAVTTPISLFFPMAVGKLLDVATSADPVITPITVMCALFGVFTLQV